MQEIWKEIKNNKEYFVSNYGNIRHNNKILKGWIQNTGYRTVALHEKKYSVHRLVAQAFIPNPEDKPQVNHIDGNKLNNKANNLEWVTSKENVKHAWDNGLSTGSYGNKNRSKAIMQMNKDGEIINFFVDSIEASKKVNICSRNIRKVCNGERKTAGGYIWRYYDRQTD